MRFDHSVVSAHQEYCDDGISSLSLINREGVRRVVEGQERIVRVIGSPRRSRETRLDKANVAVIVVIFVNKADESCPPRVGSWGSDTSFTDLVHSVLPYTAAEQIVRQVAKLLERRHSSPKRDGIGPALEMYGLQRDGLDAGWSFALPHEALSVERVRWSFLGSITSSQA